MAPPDFVDGQMPVIWYNLGGVIANLFSGILFILVSFLLPGLSFGAFFLRLLSLVGIAMALINGIPVHLGPAPNDGCNILSFLRSKKAMRAFWVQMKANEQTSLGRRLKEMPKEWFEMPREEDLQNDLVASVGVLRANRLMDEHRFHEAEDCMKYLLSKDFEVPVLHKALMTCDLVFLSLLSEDGLKKGDRLLTKEQKQFMKAMKDFPSVLRTEYALAVCSGDEEKAKGIMERFEKVSKTYPYPCEIEGERELMDMVKEKQKRGEGRDGDGIGEAEGKR